MEGPARHYYMINISKILYLFKTFHSKCGQFEMMLRIAIDHEQKETCFYACYSAGRL